MSNIVKEYSKNRQIYKFLNCKGFFTIILIYYFERIDVNKALALDKWMPFFSRLPCLFHMHFIGAIRSHFNKLKIKECNVWMICIKFVDSQVGNTNKKSVASFYGFIKYI